eukprot:scpid22808/ scgid3863/ Alpha-glucosidase yihQ
MPTAMHLSRYVVCLFLATLHAIQPGANAGLYRNVTLPVGPFIARLLLPMEEEEGDRVATADQTDKQNVSASASASSSYTPPQLSIFDVVTGRTLWSSPEYTSFLTAAKGEFSAKQNSGYFVIDNDIRDTCEELRILSWTSGDPSTARTHDGTAPNEGGETDPNNTEQSSKDSVDSSDTNRQDTVAENIPSESDYTDGRQGSSSTHPAHSAEQLVSRVTLYGTLCSIHPVEVTLRAVQVEEHDQLIVSATILGIGNPYTHLMLTYAKNENEQFYGFGHQYTQFDLGGQKFPVFSSEQGIGRGRQPLTKVLNSLDPGSGGHWYTSYTHVPFYTTSALRALLLESTEYVEFNLKGSDQAVIGLVSRNLTFRLFGGCNSIPELLTSYTAYTGRMAERTGTGTTQAAVLGLEGGTRSVFDRVYNLFQDSDALWPRIDCPISALWLQDWTGERNFTEAGELQRVGLWWVWEVDTVHYPNFSQFVKDMKSVGIDVLIYFNPMITNITERGTPYVHNYYEEGLEKGYFVRDREDKVWLGYNKAALVDLTNPDAASWMGNIIATGLLSTGAVGHMNDFGEALPLDGHLFHGDGHTLHNQYPTMWAKLNKQVTDQCEKETGKRYTYFMRSAGVFTSAYTTHYWMGDQLVSWDVYDGMKSAIVGMLSAGMSGHTLVHTDIGGYADVDIAGVKFLRTKELLMRWTELAVFSAMFRSHLGTLPNTWQVDSDADTIEQFLRMAMLFKGLQAYRDILYGEANTYGWPMVRHMVFEHWNNTALCDLGIRYEQFMFGSEILVAPVTDPGVSTVSVWLPVATKWAVRANNSTLVTGNDTYVNFSAPMGHPLFLLRYPPPKETWVDNLMAALKLIWM